MNSTPTNRRDFLTTSASLTALGAAARGGAQPGRRQMNLVSVLTDDQASWAVGAYGNREVQTPNIDRLAREGARFENSYVATPVCSPSRASYFTGLYPTRVGITDYIGLEGFAGLGLDPRTVTWPAVLQRHGYVTALMGKWHLGNLPEFHPSKFGLDHFVADRGGTLADRVVEVDGQPKHAQGAVADVITDEALRFLEENRSRPFALLMHYPEPHFTIRRPSSYGPFADQDLAPFKGAEVTIPKWPGLDTGHVKQLTLEYYAASHALDRNIGRLLAQLDKLGLAENTIVHFVGDNGNMIGHHGLHGKGNAWAITGGIDDGPVRPNMFEESIAVPLLVRWPGVTKPGAVVSQPVSMIDTFASVLGMLGVGLPRGTKQDGMDYSRLLKGETSGWRDAMLGQYDLHNDGALAFMRMIRTPQWKLVRHHFANFAELYDLENDPGETRNLYYGLMSGYLDPAHEKVRDELELRLTEWQRSIDDPILRAAFRVLEPVTRRKPIVMTPEVRRRYSENLRR